jgi:hypothetical protein
MPSDGLPGWSGNPRGQAPVAPASPNSVNPGPASNTTSPPPPAKAETKNSAALVETSEPPPVSVPEAKPGKSKASPAPTPASEPEFDESDEPTDFGLALSLLALTLVGIAMVATLFPFGRFIATGVAVVGLLGGLASLGAEGSARLYGAVAVSIHFGILAVVVLLPSWLNLDSWRPPQIDQGPRGPVAYFHSDHHLTPADWIDPSLASWQLKDARVSVRSATVGPLETVVGRGMKGMTREQYLQLVVRINNVGYERPIDLSGWAAGQGTDGVRITDSTGKTLKPAVLDKNVVPAAEQPATRIFPGHGTEVRLVFAAPSPKTDYLRLALPPAALGFVEEKDEIKFHIGSGFISRFGVPK